MASNQTKSTSAGMDSLAEVETYLAALPEDSRATLENLRQTVKSLVPDAVEVLSYGMPTFKYRGHPLVYYAAWKNHCSYYPLTQAVGEACGEDLKGYETEKGTLRFPIGHQFPDALVGKIVEARMQEIDEKKDQ